MNPFQIRRRGSARGYARGTYRSSPSFRAEQSFRPEQSFCTSLYRGTRGIRRHSRGRGRGRASISTTRPLGVQILNHCEFYLSAPRLQRDRFLQSRMDLDLWLPLSDLLKCPELRRLGVTDAVRVARLLRDRSSRLQVDIDRLLVRPIWGRGPVAVFTDLPSDVSSAEMAAYVDILPHRTFPHLLTLPLRTPHPLWIVVHDNVADAAEWCAALEERSLRGVMYHPVVYVPAIQQPPFPDLQVLGVVLVGCPVKKVSYAAAAWENPARIYMRGSAKPTQITWERIDDEDWDDQFGRPDGNGDQGKVEDNQADFIDDDGGLDGNVEA